MLRMLLVVPLLFMMAGCAGFPANVAAIAPAVQAVRDGVIKACSFQAYVASIEALIRKKDTGLYSTSDYVNAICTAATTMPLAEGPGKRQVVVKGVVIRGQRI